MIKNEKDGKIYIGQSKNISRRWHEHTKALNGNTHHSWKLQEAYNIHGICSFTFKILELCNKNELDDVENKYIEIYNSVADGYNVKGDKGIDGLRDIIKESGKFILDIDRLTKDITDSALIARFIKLYVSTVSINNEISKKTGIKKPSDLERFLNVETRTFNKVLKQLRESNLLIDDKSTTCGFKFNDSYIKKVYSIKEDDKDYYIIYKYKYIGIYNSLVPSNHKTLGHMFKIYKIFNNEMSSTTYKQLSKEVATQNIYTSQNINKFYKSIEGIHTIHGKLIYNNENMVYMNTSVYQPFKSIENKTKIDNIFKEDIN